MRSRHFVLAVASLFVFSVGSAKAVAILGSSVTGVLNVGVSSLNAFDPANTFVPSTGYLNSASNFNSPTVTIDATDIEFGAATTNDLVTADFTGNTLTVTDERTSGSTTSVGGTLTFTDTAFGGISKMSDNFPTNPVNGAISGDVITLTWAGGTVVTGDTYTAVFCITPASTLATSSVPEPATVATGLLALPVVGVWLMKRRKAKSA
jgi:hypothetical protein